ncbi:MAG: hypothetical protein ACE5OP_01705 [Candidatus Glassbacteria bacterium]
MNRLPAVISSFLFYTLLFANDGLSQVQFTEAMHVDDDTASVSNQWYASSALGPAGEVYVVWGDESGADSDILFSVKQPGDSVFSAPIGVDDGPTGTSQTKPSLSANGAGDLFVVWADDREGHKDIRFTRKLYGLPSFDPSKKVNDDVSDTDQTNPVIVAKGDSLVVVWEDHRRREADIYCSFSTDGGGTFSENVMVSDSTTGWNQWHPDVAVDPSGTLYIVWEDDRELLRFIYFSKNETWDDNFSDDVPVVDSSLALDQREPSIAVGPDGCVNVAWWDMSIWNRTVMFSRSCDGGDHFSIPVSVYTTEYINELYTDITVDDAGSIHLCHNALLWWETNQCYPANNMYSRIYYEVSVDSGVTFDSLDVTDISDGYQSDVVGNQSVQVGDGGTIHIIWSDTRYGNSYSGDYIEPYGFDVFYNTVSLDSIVGEAVRVNMNPLPSDHIHPDIASGRNDSIFVCWVDNRNPTPTIYCTMSEDGGQTFGPGVNVAEPAEGSIQSEPEIDFSPGGDVHVAWMERDGDSTGGVLFATSSDIYYGFSTPVVVSDGTELEIRNLGMVTDALGNINVIWTDARNDNGDIYFSRSTDGGVSFTPDVRVNGDVGSTLQSEPDLATDIEGDLYAIWSDYRESQPDIYFARTRDGGTEFVGERKVNSEVGGIRHAIGIDGEGKIYVMWFSSWPRLYISTSSDGGETFTDQRLVSTLHGGDIIGSCSMCVFGRTVNILWSNAELLDFCTWYEVMLAVSTDGGETFSDNLVVSEDSTRFAVYPSLDLDPDGDILTTWADPRRHAHTAYEGWMGGIDRTLKNIFFRKGTLVTGIHSGEESSRLPKAFRFYQNYPNPFNPVTTIRYDVPGEFSSGVHVILRVFTLRGEQVATLVDDIKKPGSYSVIWDGRNEQGLEVGSGIYLYQMKAGDFTSVKKMVSLK